MEKLWSSSCIEEVSVPNDDWYRIAAELLGRAGIEINVLLLRPAN